MVNHSELLQYGLDYFRPMERLRQSWFLVSLRIFGIPEFLSGFSSFEGLRVNDSAWLLGHVKHPKAVLEMIIDVLRSFKFFRIHFKLVEHFICHQCNIYLSHPNSLAPYHQSTPFPTVSITTPYNYSATRLPPCISQGDIPCLTKCPFLFPKT